jgi:transposase
MASLTKKVIHGRVYYYLRESARVDGRPKVVRTVYLGRAEDMLARLEGASEPLRVESRSFGAVAAALSVADRLGVAAAVDRACPNRGRPSVGTYILLAAVNRAVCARSKRAFADWYGQSSLARLVPVEAEALSSQRFWQAMHRLDEEQIAQAEAEITANALTRFSLSPETLVYDTTNFATFIDTGNARNQIARRGHPKQGRRDLRLVGLALAVCLDGCVPLAHRAYAGDRPDAREFPAAVVLLKRRLAELGLPAETLTLVYDKGNNSTANQALADELALALVGSLVPTHQPELLRVPRARFSVLASDPHTSVYRSRGQVYGRERTLLVSHSERFHARQRRGLAQTLLKARRQLWELKGLLARGKHRLDEPALQARIDEITRPRWLKALLLIDANLSAGTLAFRLDQDELARLDRELLGKRVIFADRHDWSDEQIISAYRAQSKAERAFRQLKHPVFAAFSPSFHWTDQKLKVHAFYCTLALTLVHLIEREAHNAGIPEGAQQILRALSEIDELTLIYPPAGGRQGRPRLRRQINTNLDQLQTRLYQTLNLAALAPKTQTAP